MCVMVNMLHGGVHLRDTKKKRKQKAKTKMKTKTITTDTSTLLHPIMGLPKKQESPTSTELTTLTVSCTNTDISKGVLPELMKKTNTSKNSKRKNKSRRQQQRRNSRNRKQRKPSAYIDLEVAKLISDCRFMSDENDDLYSFLPEEKVPVFQRREVEVCNGLLGSGAFSEVYPISGFNLLPNNILNHEQEHNRETIQANARNPRTGDCQYVIKHLRQDFLDPTESTKKNAHFHHAAADLVVEAKFLSRLSHPNIIKLRGWAAGGTSSFNDGTTDGFFLILDRLDETLSQRIMRWKMDESSSSPPPPPTTISNSLLSSPSTPKKLIFYREKLDYAFQIASALEYLHRHDIIFRDLKPDNVGFKGNAVQLFDFGLARELPEECPEEHKTFHMSGVGTRRYMAPEVFMRENYNVKADVYSWTMVFHAMLSLEKPFDNYNVALHRLLVCHEGVRPPIYAEWPTKIQQLFKSGWARSHDHRPSMKRICSKLQAMIKLADSNNNCTKTTTKEQHSKSNYDIGLEIGNVLSPNGLLLGLESSLNMMDACSNSLCENDMRVRKRLSTLLRVIETHMVGGTTNNAALHKDSAHNTDVRHVKHLRSHYL